ncbi:MAG: TetR/AcrR family transcriptional regulator, regulator of autoinduction and epiphytic fitness [Mycobacteriales bacterium]|jgi:AcrR family transcriptional regulator
MAAVVEEAGGEERPARVDGRSLRAERTRRAVVDALHALLAEGHLKVSGRQVAERAGVSLRALWSNFGDLEGLYAASNARVREMQCAAYRPVSPDLPLPERVEAFCRQRARMQEMIAPYARAAHLAQPYSPQLQRNRAVHIGHIRDEISELFESELDAAGPGRERLRNAVLVATTFNAWQMARDELGLGVDEATGMMIQTVTALLVAALAASVS